MKKKVYEKPEQRPIHRYAPGEARKQLPGAFYNFFSLFPRDCRLF